MQVFYNGKKFLAGRRSRSINEYNEDEMELAKDGEDFIKSAIEDFRMLEGAIIGGGGRVLAEREDCCYLIPEPFNQMIRGPWKTAANTPSKKQARGSSSVWKVTSTRCYLRPTNEETCDDVVMEEMLCESFHEDDVYDLPQCGLDEEGVRRAIDIPPWGDESMTKNKYRIQVEMTFYRDSSPPSCLVEKARKLPCFCEEDCEEDEELDWDECELWYYTIGTRFLVKYNGDDGDDKDSFFMPTVPGKTPRSWQRVLNSWPCPNADDD